jgi:hypothetical protein
LKPPGKDFSFNDMQVSKFESRFYKKTMQAKVLRHVQEDNSYELDIVHTDSKNKLINLRKWTIDNGVAENFVLLPGNIHPFCYTIETFDVLEKRFPTFNERLTMNQMKLDYNLLLETNFLMNISEEEAMKSGVMKMLGHSKFKEIRDYHFGSVEKVAGKSKDQKDAKD